MRFLYCFSLLLISSTATLATHVLGGYIRATPITRQAFSYQLAVTMYYDPVRGATATNEAKTLTVCFGDGSTQTIDRTSQQAWPVDPNAVQISEYTATHDYAGPGVYTVQALVFNRNSGRNTSTAESSFAITTRLQISFGAINSTPLLSLPPTGIQVAVNQRAALNLSAVDPDGDSLSYALSYPLTSSQTDNPCAVLMPVGQYQFPNDVKQAGTYRINAKTGVLTWDVPVELGYYVVALTVSERRNGLIMSQTQHELTLIVADKGGTPVTPPTYEPAQTGLITAVSDATPDDLLLTVSPNPSMGGMVQVNLQSRLAIPAIFSLLDSRGRIQQRVDMSQPLAQQRTQFDLGHYPAGLYFIRAESNGRQVVRKVVKE